MTTQDKPAVGPLSAGDWTKHNGSCVQARGQRVDVRKADGSEWLDWIADQWGLDWIWHRGEERAPSDIVEFRLSSLAPTAPVEAGGSEDKRRREITAVMSALDRFEDLAGRVTATQAEHVLASLAALSAAPAQPAAVEGAALSASDRACYEYPGEDQAALRAAFVAGACFVADNPPSTTALDEGAAGEPVAWRYRFLGNSETDAAAWAEGHWAVTIHPRSSCTLYEVKPLYTHPSPTPAAAAAIERLSAENEALRRVVKQVSLLTVEGKDHTEFAAQYPTFAGLVEEARATLKGADHD